MPYYATSQEWLRQSSLLMEARPTTTRITTKYSITKPTSKESRKQKANTEDSSAAATASATTATPKPPRGSLTLKTYDPVSGATLKYRTTKAAEVSRLILSLGRLGGRMAALPVPEGEADLVMGDAPGTGGEETGAPAAAAAGDAKDAKDSKAAAPQQQQQQQQQTGGGGGGGKGKKKKGKK